jgi:hypothetical protein
MALRDAACIEREFGDLSAFQRCPPFWVSVPANSTRFIEGLTQVARTVIGRTAGGREILALSYGIKEPVQTTTDNLSSALASKVAPCDPTDIYPTAFYGSRRRLRPVLVFQGGIHGGEITGTVASLNLCQIIETGCDLRGKPWPVIARLARESRIVVIPWLNTDAAVAWPLHRTTGASDDLYARCTHGIARSGKPYSYPKVKAIFPIPLDDTLYMGSYYNDAGVNLQYDFTSVDRQPETVAWMRCYLDERPDAVVIWHCNNGSMIGPPEYYLPEGIQHEVSRLGGAVRARLMRDDLRPGRLSWAGLPGLGKPYIEQMSAVYHVSGATPVMVEMPTGGHGNPYTEDELLDIGLITIEEVLRHAHDDGMRGYEWWSKVRKTLQS